MEFSPIDPFSLIFSFISGVFPLIIFFLVVWQIKKGIGNAAALFRKSRYVDGKFVIDGVELPEEAEEILTDEDQNEVPDIVDQLRSGVQRGSFIHIEKKSAFSPSQQKTDMLVTGTPVIEEGSNTPQLLFGLLGIIIAVFAWYFFW